MGLKRPFVSEDCQERNKHPKPMESDFKDSIRFHGISSEPDVSDGDKFLFPKYPPPLEGIENDFIFDIPFFDTEDFGASGASSSLTHGSSEEDGESGRGVHPEDASSSLDCSPEKMVPIGPNHQARIPPWVGRRNNSELVYDNADEDNEEKYLGTCIIPMPDDSSAQLEEEIVGMGRTECSCTDKGCTRCVRQHVLECQEDLRSDLDDEQFVLLGLADSGEEVAYEWSEEEGQLFDEIVFSNPASVGKNFWRHLSAAFPSRTEGELVSYYFNVFMLRKRATQNRCRFLDIDSDDDEWHGDMHRVLEEVQEFPNAYLGYNHQQAKQGKISTELDEDEDGDVDNDEDGIICSMQEAFTDKSCATFGNGEEMSNIVGDFSGLEDDSCTSFDYLLNTPTDTRGPADRETASNAWSRSGESCEDTNGPKGVDNAQGTGRRKSEESN